MIRKKKTNTSKYDSSFYLALRLFNEHIKSQSMQLLIAVLCMVIISLTTALQAGLLQPVLDDIFLAKKVSVLYIIPIVVFANSFIKGIASFYETSTMKRLGQKIITDIQLRLYTNLIHEDVEFLDEYPSGNLISRFTNDINAMRKSVSDVFTIFTKESFTLLGLIGVMFYQHFTLALLAILILPISIYPITKLGGRMKNIAKNMQEELGDFTIRLDETFKNIRIIKSYSREQYEIKRAKNVIDNFLKIYKKSSYVEAGSSPIMEIIGGIMVALVIMYGGMQVLSDSTTPGAFFSFIAALLMSYRPLKVISNLNTSFQEGMAACRRLFIIIDHEPEIYDSGEKYTMENYDIRFRNVYFSYKSEQKTLNSIDLFIPQGKTVAIVGLSGSGKTTILNLIQRLYEGEYGDILIGGKDIRDIPISVLRQNTAIVSQDTALFDDTIYENIRYGDLKASPEDITNAAMAAAAHDFIINLPDGYDSNVGQNGIKLSGGQKQRIAIARAILKNAPILLLDEATSALDNVSEQQVQTALDYIKKGRTTVVIAHRLSTIENADLIYVISQGKVIESGTHKKLLNNGDEYYRLYNKYHEQDNIK